MAFFTKLSELLKIKTGVNSFLPRIHQCYMHPEDDGGDCHNAAVQPPQRPPSPWCRRGGLLRSVHRHAVHGQREPQLISQEESGDGHAACTGRLCECTFWNLEPVYGRMGTLEPVYGRMGTENLCTAEWEPRTRVRQNGNLRTSVWQNGNLSMA